jgi:hypothetical protein
MSGYRLQKPRGRFRQAYERVIGLRWIQRQGCRPVGPGMSMVGSGIRRVIVSDAALEVEVRGSGEAVVLIHTALIADEFEPLRPRWDAGPHD